MVEMIKQSLNWLNLLENELKGKGYDNDISLSLSLRILMSWGLGFPQMIEWILNVASERWRK